MPRATATAIPETRKVEYVAFALNQVPGGVPEVSGADVQQYYNDHHQQFQVPEEVRVRHILIKVPTGANAQTVAAAKAKAEGILKQLKSGANFADLAKKYSDDPGSKAQGGELGFIQHGSHRTGVRSGRILAAARSVVLRDPHAIRLSHFAGGRKTAGPSEIRG